MAFLLYNLTQVIKDLDLRERHVGDLQGLQFQDFAKHPKAYEAFCSTDLEVPVWTPRSF